MSDETTIRECPFCGGEARIMNLNHGTWVECSNYHYERHQVCVHAKTEAEAIAAWNTRAELGSGTCRITASMTDGLCSDNPRQWFRLSCGHSFTLDGLGAPVACPVCGKAVER